MTSRLAVRTVDFTASMSCFNSIETITKDVVKPGVATLQSPALVSFECALHHPLGGIELAATTTSIGGRGLHLVLWVARMGKTDCTPERARTSARQRLDLQTKLGGSRPFPHMQGRRALPLGGSRLFSASSSCSCGPFGGYCSRSPEDLTTRSPAS